MPAAPPAIGLAAALLFALIGGALLNLMPCVFPVLSLKVMGFAAHAGDRRALALGGLAYTAGVVLSFVGLAALLLVLRAGGEQLGWGFQLQSPAVIAVLAALFTLIGLNLAGVFEFGSVLPSGLATLRARHPLVDSLLTGVLAVAVASPCTAPFMGASLGLAATLPAAPALAIFAALGLGMALPYLGASLWPGLARALPRPGAWMARFKVLMAFPMFATVVWLLWVLGQQSGIDGVESAADAAARADRAREAAEADSLEAPAAQPPTAAPTGAAQPWPSSLPEQVRAVAQLLSASPAPLPLAAIEASFKGKGPWKKGLPRILETLEALGRSRQAGGGWRGGVRYHEPVPITKVVLWLSCSYNDSQI